MSSLATQNIYSIVQYGFVKFGYPFILIFGTIGSTISISVFAQKAMRQNPCSIYLIAYNVANSLFIWIAAFPNYLAIVFGIDLASHNLSFCRFRFYAIFVLVILCPSYLILASVDRALITSRDICTRQRSTPRLAYILITGTTLLWCVFYLHAFIKINIYEKFPGFNSCIYDPDIYAILMTWNSIIIDGILPPTLMMIFALMTLKNIRDLRVVQVARAPNNGGKIIRTKDRQFLVLVFAEIVLYIILSFMQPIVLFYIEITKDTVKTVDQFSFHWLLARIANFLVYVSLCMNFYLNLIASRAFRNHVKILFINISQFAFRRHR